MTSLPLLFLGAFLDAVIGPNLFIPGEPFLLAAGYQIYQGIYLAGFSVLLGALAGDQLSYFIGRRYGQKLIKSLIRRQPRIKRPIARCRLLMYRKGNFVLTFSRLLGPVAWFVPCMAGISQISWARFTFYSFIGLILGVGQFLIWGYLLAYGLNSTILLESAKLFIAENKTAVFILTCGGVVMLIRILTRKVVCKN